MGRALLGGILAKGILSQSQFRLVEPNGESQAWWTQHYPDVAVESLNEAVRASGSVLLAVKPGVMLKVIDQKPGFWDGKLVVSIAAGVHLRKLQESIGHCRVIRVMPNTPSLVGGGTSAYCCGSEVTDADKASVPLMLQAVGIAVEVDESQMDAVTGLSGSGPAYICLVIESLADGGVAAGLPRPLAMQLATQTVLGTAQLIQQTGKHPGELKDAVASPGGTTIAGLKALEENGLRSALINAVCSATDRSRQLG